MAAQSKFRPSFTQAQIRYILSIAKKQSPLTQQDCEIIAILSPFAAKIDNNALVPAYKTAPPIEEQLGFSALPEQERELAFKKYQANPAHCTLQELDLAHAYRYEMELMLPEEMQLYELQLMRGN
jgi:hypothetical protein